MKITETKPKYNDAAADGTTTNTPAIFTSFQWHRENNIRWMEYWWKQNKKNDIDHIVLANWSSKNWWLNNTTTKLHGNLYACELIRSVSMTTPCSERMMDNVNGRISGQYLWEKVRYSGMVCDFEVIFGAFFFNRLFIGHRPRSEMAMHFGGPYANNSHVLCTHRYHFCYIHIWDHIAKKS